MLIYGYIPKSKPKKLTKAQQEQKAEFIKSINDLSKKGFSRSSAKSTKKVLIKEKSFVPPGRETPKYESLNTGFIPCTKPVDGNTYTGEKMKGVATMHKSNAVPVFTDNEAKEISSMRR
jgi:hypothetical protein